MMGKQEITYLYPQALRRGQPAIHFVCKEKWAGEKNTYYLGVYHTLLPLKGPPPYKGLGEEYAGRSLSVITPKLYKALVDESKANEKRFKPRRPVPINLDLEFYFEVRTRKDEKKHVANWVACYAPKCKAKIIGYSPNQNPMVRLTAPDLETLVAAVKIYDGDNGQAEELLKGFY